MPYMTISLAGLALGVGLILLTLIRWWFAEGGRWAALVPFVLAFLYGMLAALAALGSVSVLGGVTWVAVWAANLVGYAGLVWGVGGTAPDVTRGANLVLTPGGYVIVFLFTLVFIGLWKWASKVPNVKLGFGFVSGSCLALSGTVAGIAAVPLASAANMLGVGFTNALT